MPTLPDILGIFYGIGSEHMRMTTDHLFNIETQHVINIKMPLFLKQICHKKHQKQDVSQLFTNVFRAVRANSFDQFVDFFTFLAIEES